MNNRLRHAVVACLTATLAPIQLLHGAPITTLYSTGLDSSRGLLGPREVDPHYTLASSPAGGDPGAEVFTLAPGFPVGPWAAEGPASRWIAPAANQAAGSAPGQYVYTTTFDMESLDPSTAEITGFVSADDVLQSIKLNGVNISFRVGGFDNLHPITIPKGSAFQEGINTLQFTVLNGGAAANPTGFRAQLTGTAVAPGEAPSIVRHPVSREVIEGGTLILGVEAAGSPELTYQWLFEGNALDGATESRLVRTGIGAAGQGAYSVRVTNPFGNILSEIAQVTVLKGFPGLYDTGVDDQRNLLPDDAVDSHYILTLNPQSPGSADALAQSSIPSPPWVANSFVSRWIGPTANSTAVGGEYRYRLTLDLTNYDPATAYVAGEWASDDAGFIFLNGADTGFRSAGFGGLVPFALRSGFISGINSLEFRVVNGGANPTGLRVENVRGSANRSVVQPKAPRVVTQPRGTTIHVTGDFELAVVADGTQPLSYQWMQNGTPVEGATASNLELRGIRPSQAGRYTVRVSNNLGSVVSDPADIVVVEPMEYGVFNTGEGLSGAALPPGQQDPHWLIIQNPDPQFQTIRALTTAGPIPPWVANDADSAWISSRPDNAAVISPGVYRYRLLFMIETAEEAATASLTAKASTDDGSRGAFLNGTRVSFNSPGFGSFGTLSIPSGELFVQGLNILDIVVENGGADRNPSGLRVDEAVLEGVKTRPKLHVRSEGGSIRLNWSSRHQGAVLETAPALGGPWTDSGLSPEVEVPLSEPARYFRLNQP